jgi:hypothetical protein
MIPFVAAKAFFEGSFTGHPAHVKYRSARTVLATEEDTLPTLAVAPGAGKLASANNKSSSMCW